MREQTGVEAAEDARASLGALRLDDLERGMVGMRQEGHRSRWRAALHARVQLAVRVGLGGDAVRAQLVIDRA